MEKQTIGEFIGSIVFLILLFILILFFNYVVPDRYVIPEPKTVCFFDIRHEQIRHRGYIYTRIIWDESVNPVLCNPVAEKPRMTEEELIKKLDAILGEDTP